MIFIFVPIFFKLQVMYELVVTKRFSAAHRLREYDGDCARMHGHNWQVQICVGAETLDKTGFAIDFNRLDQITAEVISRFDHTYINEIPPFDQVNPTAENLARIIYRDIIKRLPQTIQLKGIKLWETESYSVTYRE
jgi:6-pyruvoyltetrahydropterin/6-carboxytetrahydropterin synthase